MELSNRIYILRIGVKRGKFCAKSRVSSLRNGDSVGMFIVFLCGEPMATAPQLNIETVISPEAETLETRA